MSLHFNIHDGFVARRAPVTLSNPAVKALYFQPAREERPGALAGMVLVMVIAVAMLGAIIALNTYNAPPGNIGHVVKPVHYRNA